MSQVILPDVRELNRALSGLLGKEVKSKVLPAANGLSPGNAKGLFVAVYDDGAGAIAAMCLSDLTITAALAAALTLIPAGVVKEAVKLNKISSDLADNAREVVNILANSYGGKRVRLIEFWPPAGPMTPAAAQWVQAATARLDVQVEVTGYPAGQISFFAPKVTE